MKVLFFGITKDIVGQRELSNISTDPNETVDTLIDKLTQDFPELSTISSLAISVNQKYAERNTKLRETDIVALIPPVSGG